MRDIKFRAWNKAEKIMVDLQSITPLALDEQMNTQLSMKGGSGLFIPFVKDCRIMQYTGLKDKNGKEIYEGDVLSICDGSINGINWMRKNREIKFSECSFNVPEWEGDSTHWFEIIGNIHENPKLLEEDK